MNSNSQPPTRLQKRTQPTLLPSFMRRLCTFLLLATTTCAPILAQTPPRPIEIKVVVISMFEQGADTGDTPGEYQYWVERQHLSTVLPFPQGYHDLRLNPKPASSASSPESEPPAPPPPSWPSASTPASTSPTLTS